MFLIIYILLVLTFGFSMVIAETSIGRMTKKSPVGAFKTFGNAKWLKVGGWINVIIPLLIVPYYSVIGGWVLKYLMEYLFQNGSTLADDGYFGSFISNGLSCEIYFIFFALITLFIVALARVELARPLLDNRFSCHTCFYTSILKSLSVAG